MLHSINPADFVSVQILNTQWTCPDCGNPFVFGNGVVAVCHYRSTTNGHLGVGLMNFCSKECLLDFENSSFMGKA